MKHRRTHCRRGTLALLLSLTAAPSWADAPAADAPAAGTPAADAPNSTLFWLSRAQAEAAGLGDPVEKAGVLTAVAHQFAGGGDVGAGKRAAESAISVVQKIPEPLAQFRAYLGLAQFYDAVNDADGIQRALAGAQADADALPAGTPKDMANNQLAGLRARGGGLADARKHIDAVPDAASKAQTYAALAGQLAQTGRKEEYAQAIQLASAAADGVKDPMGAGELKALIARTQADAGDVDGAAATATSIPDPSGQAAAWTAIAAAFSRSGQKEKAQDAINKVVTAVANVPEDRRAAVWLDVARARQGLGDTNGAQAGVESAVRAADRLEPADRADAFAAAARLRSDLNDGAGAAILIDDAAAAARTVADPRDAAEVNMGIAAAQARAGMGAAAQQSVAAAEAAAARVPQPQQRPGGDPPPAAYMDVIQSAATAGDAPTAQAIAVRLNNPQVKHDAALAIAASQVNAGQYQAAEATAQQEGSVDAEASVCGMIAANLARTRTPADAAQWVDMLPTASDKVAGRLAVAGFLASKQQGSPPATQP